MSKLTTTITIDDGDDHKTSIVRMQTLNLSQMLEIIEEALRGHGFNFDGNLTIEKENENN